ncbi:MAG TPA: hypothetical protein VLS89_09920, partial [Candidatus Nanopelagicales bacterium]|nr:hypothetical protein [Candidatus Nanopelagicales bacterium]
GAVSLWPGDKVYAGMPGQGIYYTNAETIRGFATSPEDMWEALQVPAHERFGYRMQIAEYEVLYPVSVPAGRCRNNGSFGGGGGFQYMIADHQMLLRSTGRVLDLRHGAHLMV